MSKTNTISCYFLPLLISIVPLLDLYHQNISSTMIGQFLLLVLPLIVIAYGVTMVFYIFFKSIHKATLFTSSLLLFFYYFHYLLEVFNSFSKTKLGFILFRLRHIIPVLFLFFAWLFYKILTSRKEPLFPITAMTIVFGTLTLFSLTKIAHGEYINHKRKIANLMQTKPLLKQLIQSRTKIDDSDFPDVYFIILDSYTNNNVLLKYFAYNNTLTQKLEQIGFYIAGKSHSNYPCTLASLSSSLNLQYHKPISHFKELINNNIVFKFFDHLNYHIINIKGCSSTTRSLDSFKQNSVASYAKQAFYQLTSTLDFLYHFLKTRTFLYYFPYLDRFELQRHKRILLHQLKELKETTNLGGPKFVFCHLLCPHPPFVLGSEKLELVEPYKEGYLRQTIFINEQIYLAINHILTQSCKNPVIIVQGAHGAIQDNVFLGEPPTHHPLPTYLIKQAFPILHAWHLPKQNIQQLYPTLSSVNTFRFLFDRYFGTKLNLLKDESFMFQKNPNFYTFIKTKDVLSAAQKNLINFEQYFKTNFYPMKES